MKSQQPTYIQLDTGEDIPSIRDRLSFIRGQRVLLIWPENGTALTRKLDLVFVQREARRRVIQLALVTHDTQVINHANELGISTFETIKEAENSRWKRGRTKVFIQRYHKPEDEPDPDDLMPVASRVRKSNKRLPAVLRILIRVAILSIVIGVIIATLYVTIPTATVTLVMQQEAIQVDTTIIADPEALDVDIENRVIPAPRYSRSVNTTQQIRIDSDDDSTRTRAFGEVTFTNNSNTSITVPSGTQVRTSSTEPVFFELTTTVIVPANNSVESIPILASDESIGAVGNVAANTIINIEGELADTIDVTNELPTTGGADNNTGIVTISDIERVESNARQSLQGLAYSDIESQLTDDQRIIIESISIPPELVRSDWIDFSHEVGDSTNLLTLNMRAIVEALVIDRRFAQQIVFAQVSSNIPPNMILNPDSFLYRPGPFISIDDDNRITFQAFGEGIASAQVDVFRLQSDLTGRSLEEAQRLILATVDIATNSQPTITISPEWLTHMPLLPVRINIEIEGNN